METYDAIVIGAGQAGVPLARAFAAAGRKTALIEAKLVGGTCINYGCTPTKTMIASANAAENARRAPRLGVLTGSVAVDLRKVRERKDEVVRSFRDRLRSRIVKSGVDLIEGKARFSGRMAVDVALNTGGTTSLSAGIVIIDTGGRPRVPQMAGIDEVPYLDSTSIMELDEIPSHLLILGGGHVAVEFAQMFRRFGSQVTIIQKSGRLLSREDPDVSDAILQIFQKDGIRVILNATARQVGPGEDRMIRLAVTTPDGDRTLEGSHFLTAIGRTPNTEDLNLSAAGIQTDEQGAIPVDEHLQTNIQNVYATGDVNGGPAFTHISYDDYRILKTNLLENGSATTKGRLVPFTIFMDPQLGRVGLTETEARQQRKNIRVAKIRMDQVSRAIETDQTRGLQKAIVDAETGQILGAAILGLDGGEIMAMIEIAMIGKLPYTTLREAIFTHPSLSESLNTLFSNLSA